MFSKITIAQQDTIHFLDVSEIVYCQSDNCYTNLFLNNNEHLMVVKSLAKFSSELNSRDFIRISQSYLINKNYIKRINRRRKSINLNNLYDLPFTITLKELLMLLSRVTNAA